MVNIDYNVAFFHPVRNDGGTFTNEKTGTINNNRSTLVDNSDERGAAWGDGSAAGGVANYASNYTKPSIFYNYGQINNNISARSSGGVLNKAGVFYNKESGEICNRKWNSAGGRCCC